MRGSQTDLCAFYVFQKVVFRMALYTKEVHLQSFIMIQCKTRAFPLLDAKPFVFTTFAPEVYSIQWFIKKIENFHCSHNKMSAKYAKINRVGSLDTGFQQGPLVQFLFEFS